MPGVRPSGSGLTLRPRVVGAVEGNTHEPTTPVIEICLITMPMIPLYKFHPVWKLCWRMAVRALAELNMVLPGGGFAPVPPSAQRSSGQVRK